MDLVLGVHVFADESCCSLDSPASYVQNLANLFSDCQLLGEYRTPSTQHIPDTIGSTADEHHQLLTASAGSYASIPYDIRSQIEVRLKRSSEFFVTVVLDFVIRDLGQLLDKYAKKGEKWMED